MTNCRQCGAPLNPQERFCGYCGTDQMAAPPQAVYTPPQARAAGGGSLARAAMGLGIAGGLLGIVWGALGPFLTNQWPGSFQWSVYGTSGLKWVSVPLAIGLVLGLLGIVGGVGGAQESGGGSGRPPGLRHRWVPRGPVMGPGGDAAACGRRSGHRRQRLTERPGSRSTDPGTVRG